MKGLSPLARSYIWTVLAAGALALMLTEPSVPKSDTEWFVFAILTVAAATVQAFPVVTPRNQSYEPTPIFVFAGILLLPPGVVSLLIVIAFIPEWIKARKPWYIQLFNISIYRLQAITARATLLALSGDSAGDVASPMGLIGALLAAGAFTVVNHLLLALVLHLARGHSWRDTRLFELEYFLTDATLACTGAILALLWQTHPSLAILVGAPTYLIYRALDTPNLQEETRTDPKTGLFNAKRFNHVLQEELRRARRFDRPLAVIMCDLDYLRDINNSYGHIAGDAVIKGVADIIAKSLREYDVAARFGGEEFVLMLPETDRQLALGVAERLRSRVAEARFAVTTSVEPIRATISLGVASFPEDADDSADLVHQADLAVYLSKRLGRNRASACCSESRTLGLGRGLNEREVIGAAEESPREVGQPPSDGALHPEVPLDGVGRAGGEGAHVSALGGTRPQTDDRQLFGGPTAASRLPERPFSAPEGPPRAKRARDLSWPLALFVEGVVLAAATVWLLSNPLEWQVDWGGIAALAAMTAGAQSLAIETYGRGRISTSAVIILAGGIVFGMPGALLLAPLIPVTVWLRDKGLLHRAIFDLGDTVLASAAAAFVYHRLAALAPNPEPVLLLVPAVLSAMVYFFVNVGLISVAIALSERRSPRQVWREKFSWLPVHYLAFGLLAFLIAMAYQAIGIYGLVSFAIPPVMLRYVMKQYIERTEANVVELKRVNAELLAAHEAVVKTLNELRATYADTLAALTAALDSRDSDTEGHCEQVVEYVAEIASLMGLPETDIQGLLNGALLHDVGKIGVPDAILGKRGPLTPEEWQTMRTHPELGHRMLRNIGFLEGALPTVLHHHERYDGSGYPDGLKGEQIPLAARIFAVADAFHAMTSDRPYRSALPMEDARKEIVRCAGSQFDPRVVEAFLRLDPAKLSTIRSRARAAATAANGTGPRRAPVPVSA